MPQHPKTLRYQLASLTTLIVFSPLAAAQQSEPATLSPVVISAERSPETNYTIPSSILATGLDLSLRETPQSISVTTQKRMEEQQLNSVSEAIAHTPGIYFQKYGNSADGYHYYVSRGYAIDNLNIDGLDASGDGSGYGLSLHNTDSAIYESLSVVRGSTGLRNGLGDPGGNIQMQRKRPSAETQISIEAGAGSWGHYRTVLDANGALNEGGSLRGRAVAVYDRGGLWQHRARQDGKTLYGILEYDITPQTMATVGLQMSDIHSKHSATGSFATYYGDEDNGYHLTTFKPRDNNAAAWSYGKRRKNEIFTRLEHNFNDDWKLSAAYSYRFGKSNNLYGMGGTYDIKADGSAQLVTIKNNSTRKNTASTCIWTANTPSLTASTNSKSASTTTTTATAPTLNTTPAPTTLSTTSTATSATAKSSARKTTTSATAPTKNKPARSTARPASTLTTTGQSLPARV